MAIADASSPDTHSANAHQGCHLADFDPPATKIPYPASPNAPRAFWTSLPCHLVRG